MPASNFQKNITFCCFKDFLEKKRKKTFSFCQTNSVRTKTDFVVRPLLVENVVIVIVWSRCMMW